MEESKRSKLCILDKYADFLRHEYPKCEVTVTHRVTHGRNGTGGVWGIVEIHRRKKSPVLLRVRPRYGVDEVCFNTKNNRFWRIRQVLTKEQLQLQFGYGPAPRAVTAEMFPFSGLTEEETDIRVGGDVFVA